MATKYIKFTGPCEWAKVYPHQIDRAFEENKGGNWSIVVDLSPADQLTFNNIGAKAKLKGTKATFRCYEKAAYGDVAPPTVTLPAGYDVGTPIGNGSIVTVDVEIYDYNFKGRPGKALRLKGVTVNELVEYKKPEPAAENKLNDDAVPF